MEITPWCVVYCWHLHRPEQFCRPVHPSSRNGTVPTCEPVTFVHHNSHTVHDLHFHALSRLFPPYFLLLLLLLFFFKKNDETEAVLSL